MKTPRLLLAAAAVALLSTAALAVPPTADQVTVSGPSERSHHTAKLMALLPTPELRAAYKMHMHQATKGMAKADKKAYRKHEMQRIRAMNDAEKATWRKQIMAEFNSLPQAKREKVVQRMADREANPHQHQHRHKAQSAYPAGDDGMDDMTAPRDQATPQ